MAIAVKDITPPKVRVFKKRPTEKPVDYKALRKAVMKKTKGARTVLARGA